MRVPERAEAALAIDAVVFDLDGTLWDTCSVCAIAWNRVLQRNGIAFRTITTADVRSVAGMPHAACIRTVFVGLAETQLAVLIEETQLEDNRAIAEHGGKLYSGVREGLARLHARFPLYIVSNCQAGYIETFLASTDMAALFRDFECWGNTGQVKADNLKRVIERNQLRAPVFVGDTAGDQEAAQSNGVPFIHVSYGFGACRGAQRTAASFAELAEQLLR